MQGLCGARQPFWSYRLSEQHTCIIEEVERGGGGGRNFDEFHPFLSRDIVGLSCSSKEILLQGRKRAKKVQQLIRPLNFDLKGKKALTVDPTPRAKKTKERDSTSRKV